MRYDEPVLTVSRRFAALAACLLLCAFGAAVAPLGCATSAAPAVRREAGPPLVRVRLLSDQPRATVTLAQGGVLEADGRQLGSLDAGRVLVERAGGKWRVTVNDGSPREFGEGELAVRPADALVGVEDRRYRGAARFVASSNAKLDLVNVVAVDDYLAGVVPSEVFPTWPAAALEAQALAARTYVLYEAATVGRGRAFDVYADVRSQAYQGVKQERPATTEAVRRTAGLVLAHGARGRERIFKTYFSACCGGVGQSNADAFGEALIPPLAARSVGRNCAEAKTRFRWEGETLDKRDLGRRLRAWGEERRHPIRALGTLDRLEVAAKNEHGRPVRFAALDARGGRYTLLAEQFRWAVNGPIEASEDKLSSSYVEVADLGPTVRLGPGGGWGHGVGLCQWCAKAWASGGASAEEIARESYPSSVIVRAY